MANPRHRLGVLDLFTVGDALICPSQITWTCDVGGPNNTNSPLHTTVVDDTETAAFTWLPHGSWDTDPKNLTMFSGQTGQCV
jgi:hypothetical protein